MPRKIRVPADKEANRQSQQLSRQRHREYVAGLERRLNEMERRGVQATIEVQEAARAVAAKNEKLLALLALHGVSHDEINAFLSSTLPLPPRGGVPAPATAMMGHTYSESGIGHLPWDARQTAQEPRRSSMPVVPTPCCPRPAATGPRQPAETGRSQANVPPSLLGAGQHQSQGQDGNRIPDRSPPPACASMSPRSTRAPATGPEPVSHAAPSLSYPHDEPRAIETSRCGPRPGGGCGPRGVPCRPENARTTTCAQTRSCDSTPQQPVGTAPRELAGQMVTPCDAAANIIAEIYHHGDVAAARASLACGTEGPCFISNLDLLGLMESHG